MKPYAHSYIYEYQNLTIWLSLYPVPYRLEFCVDSFNYFKSPLALIIK